MTLLCEIVCPASFWEVDVPLSLTVFENRCHHQVFTEHELVLDFAGFGIIWELYKECSSWGLTFGVRKVHEIALILFQHLAMNGYKLREEGGGLGVIPHLVHLCRCETWMSPHHHVRECVHLDPSFEKLLGSHVLESTVEVVNGRVASDVGMA